MQPKCDEKAAEALSHTSLFKRIRGRLFASALLSAGTCTKPIPVAALSKRGSAAAGLLLGLRV
jgi:hypothetical protein